MSHLKGFLEWPVEWIDLGIGVHLAVNLIALLRRLKEEERTKNRLMADQPLWLRLKEGPEVLHSWTALSRGRKEKKNTPLTCWGEGGRKGGAGSGNLFGLLKWNSSSQTVSQLIICFHLVRKSQATHQPRTLWRVWLLLDTTSKSNRNEALFLLGLSENFHPREKRFNKAIWNNHFPCSTSQERA